MLAEKDLHLATVQKPAAIERGRCRASLSVQCYGPVRTLLDLPLEALNKMDEAQIALHTLNRVIAPNDLPNGSGAFNLQDRSGHPSQQGRGSRQHSRLLLQDPKAAHVHGVLPVGQVHVQQVGGQQ